MKELIPACIALVVLCGALGAAEQLGPKKLDRDKDLISLHYDHALDKADGHSAAADRTILQSMFGTDWLKKHVVAVSGAYGRNARTFNAKSNAVMDAAWNDCGGWLAAHENRDRVVADLTSRWMAVLKAGGDLWAKEGGQSDITADVVRKITKLMPDLTTARRIHVVQHSGWNERQTTDAALAYTKQRTDYIRISDANAYLNVKGGDDAFEKAARAHPLFGKAWKAAFAYYDRKVRLDFSDTGELMQILGLGKVGINEFRQRFLSAKQSSGTKQQPVDKPIYFPPPESKGGWRKLDRADDIRRLGGMEPAKLAELKQCLLKSDQRGFAADVIRHGYIVLEVERGNSAKTDVRRIASCSKAIWATVLAIASQRSQHGQTPRKMAFDDPAFDFIPWAKPLSDPRKAKIKVKQILNHMSGIAPEASGAPNRGPWRHVLGYDGDPKTAKLAFDPGTACGYSTFALYHASLVCENVTGQPYDKFAIQFLFQPIGRERWWFQYFDGGGPDGDKREGRHPSHAMGMPARDLARIAYCMLHDGRWRDEQVIPQWFVEQSARPTHDVKTQELRFKLNAQTFSQGWQLPALLTGEDGTPSGRGIPRDARYKPGSGGQLIAFVPSLDLVVTRQTGSSGGWQFEEYLCRACACVARKSPAPTPKCCEDSAPPPTLTLALLAGTLCAGEPKQINDVELDDLHGLIKRQAGGSRWMMARWVGVSRWRIQRVSKKSL